jgi:hypothetical protein
MKRRDETGLVTPLAVSLVAVFGFVAAVLLDGGTRLVAIQRAVDEAGAAGDHALKNLDVSRRASGGLRLDPETARRDAVTFVKEEFGHEGEASVEGTDVTVTVRIDYRGRLIRFFDGTVEGTATASPLRSTTTTVAP